MSQRRGRWRPPRPARALLYSGRSMRPGTPILLALLGAVAACKGEPPKAAAPCEQVVDLSLRASDRINPGDDGGPLPVVVRVYQLKERARVDAADFQGLWPDDAQALGD